MVGCVTAEHNAPSLKISVRYQAFRSNIPSHTDCRCIDLTLGIWLDRQSWARIDLSSMRQLRISWAYRQILYDCYRTLPHIKNMKGDGSLVTIWLRLDWIEQYWSGKSVETFITVASETAREEAWDCIKVAVIIGNSVRERGWTIFAGRVFT